MYQYYQNMYQYYLNMFHFMYYEKYFRNHVLIPKHKQPRKTLRFVRLMTGFNVGAWLKEILEFLIISVDIQISIGFSFIGRKAEWKLEEGEFEYIYYYAAKDLCTINERFYDMNDVIKFANEIEQYEYSDFLSETFFETESGDPFINSGIMPHVLVANSIWITK